MSKIKAALAGGVAIATLTSLADEVRAQVASDQSGQLEEVVVTARRREEVLQATPVSVSALSATALDRLNVRSLDHVGDFVPNIAIVPTGGFIAGSTTFIRGIGEHDILLNLDSPVGLYLDGVYLAAQMSSNFDLVDLQRVEVLRGPQGTLFGRNTTGGAINIITKTPNHDFGIEEKIGYGSYDELLSRTEINTGDIGSTGLRAIVAYQHRQRDGYVDNINTPGDHDPGALNSDAAWVKVHGDWDGLTADYAFDFDQIHGVSPLPQTAYLSPTIAAYYGQSPSLGGATLSVTPDRQQTVSLRPVSNQRIGVIGHSLTLQYELTPDITVKSISGYRQYWASLPQSYTPPGLLGRTVTGIAPLTLFEGDDFQRLVQYSEELQLLGTTDRWTYVGGLYYFHERTNETDLAKFTYLLSPTLGVNLTSNNTAEQSSTSEAVFGQASYHPPILDDKLELTGGLRFTRDQKTIDQTSPALHIDTQHFYNLSYNAIVNYQWTPEFMTYARVGTGFRSGGFNLRATAGQAYNFAPEKATVYEAGIKSEWLNHRLRANLSAFYTDYKNLQVSQYTGATAAGGNATGIKNANASYTGFELEAQARPIESLTVDASVGYTHPEYQQIFFPDPVTGALRNFATSAHFPYVPEVTSHIGVQYDFPAMSFGQFLFRVDYAYQTAKYFFTTNLPNQNPFSDLIKAPDSNLVGARLTLTDVSVWNGMVNLEASVWGENLLDDHYLIQGIDFGPQLGFATKTFGQPRRFGFDIKATY